MTKPIQITLTVRDMTRADFLNALDNALRATSPGAHAALTVEPTNKSKEPKAKPESGEAE